MSEFRYVIKYVHGNNYTARRRTLDRIKAMIRTMRRTLELPMIRFSARLPGSTFILGLAVHDDRYSDDTLPEYISELFRRLGMPLTAIERGMWPQRGREIEQFLHGTSEWDYLTVPIRFEPGAAGDFLSADDTEVVTPPSKPEAYDRLLWWCSSKGSGTVSQLADITKCLGLIELDGSVWGVIKKLVLLGHIEVFQEAGGDWSWSVAPLTVVETSTNGSAFLAGAQSGRHWRSLEERLGATRGDTNGGTSRVKIHADRLDGIETILGFVPRRVVNPVDRWADLLPNMEEWKRNLVPAPDIATQPHVYQFERYTGDCFIPATVGTLRAGLYKAKHAGEQFNSKIVYRDVDGQWLNGDFASLRFLAFRIGGLSPQAIWKQDGSTVVIPLRQRWPTLYERALVLASGQLPATMVASEYDDRLLVYRKVPLTALKTLAGKLEVQLIT